MKKLNSLFRLISLYYADGDDKLKQRIEICLSDLIRMLIKENEDL